MRNPIHFISAGLLGLAFLAFTVTPAGVANSLLPDRDFCRTSSYGSWRFGHLHAGIDFSTGGVTGVPVLAVDTCWVWRIRIWNGGYGKYVRIRHNGEYKTAYAHMKSIANGMKTGKRVRQGQIIGYVGTTGRSTGAHLHYEILKNGKQVNPMKVKMPSGEKLKGEELERFLAEAVQLDALYAEILGVTTVAQIEP